MPQSGLEKLFDKKRAEMRLAFERTMEEHEVSSSGVVDSLAAFLKAKTEQEAQHCHESLRTMMAQDGKASPMHSVLLVLIPLVISHVKDQTRGAQPDFSTPKGLFFYQCLWLLSHLGNLAVGHIDYELWYFTKKLNGHDYLPQAMQASLSRIIDRLKETLTHLKTTEATLSQQTRQPENKAVMVQLRTRLQDNLCALEELSNGQPVAAVIERFIFDEYFVAATVDVLNYSVSASYKEFERGKYALKERMSTAKASIAEVEKHLKAIQEETNCIEAKTNKSLSVQRKITRQIKCLKKGTYSSMPSVLPYVADEFIANDFVRELRRNTAEMSEQIVPLQSAMVDFQTHACEKNKEGSYKIKHETQLAQDNEELQAIQEKIEQHKTLLDQVDQGIEKLKHAGSHFEWCVAVERSLKRELKLARESYDFVEIGPIDSSVGPNIHVVLCVEVSEQETREDEMLQLKSEMGHWYCAWLLNLQRFNRLIDVFHVFYQMTHATERMNQIMKARLGQIFLTGEWDIPAMVNALIAASGRFIQHHSRSKENRKLAHLWRETSNRGSFLKDMHDQWCELQPAFHDFLLSMHRISVILNDQHLIDLIRSQIKEELANYELAVDVIKMKGARKVPEIALERTEWVKRTSVESMRKINAVLETPVTVIGDRSQSDDLESSQRAEKLYAYLSESPIFSTDSSPRSSPDDVPVPNAFSTTFFSSHARATEKRTFFEMSEERNDQREIFPRPHSR